MKRAPSVAEKKHNRSDVKHIVRNLLYPVVTVVVMIAVYWLAAAIIDEVFILPSPTVTVGEMFRLMTLKTFWGAYFSTLARSVVGFLISFTLAAFLAIVAANITAFEKLLRPLMAFLRALPTMAAVLLLTIWMSAKITPVIIALLVIMPVLYSAMYAAFRASDEKLAVMSRAFRVPKKKRILKLYLPSALPMIASSGMGALSLNLKLVIAAEILALTSSSLGSLMLLAKNYLEMPTLLALNLMAAFTGIALEYGLGALLKFVMKRRRPCSKRQIVKASEEVHGLEGVGVLFPERRVADDVELRGIQFGYGDKVIYNDFNFKIDGGQTTAIMGASGCGKTTLLNIIAGLSACSGTIMGAEDVGYIFQEARLIPHMTVRENIAYVSNADPTELLKTVRLDADAELYADELSVGMAQRVSFVRAFAVDSKLVLMDEPFRGLDVSLKDKLMKSFAALRERNSRTVILVTHDPEEAVMLADRIVVLKDGEVIYDRRKDGLNTVTCESLRQFLIDNT